MSARPAFVGTVAVVTGAAQGMGRAFATGLVRAGAEVVIGDIDESKLATTAAEIEALVGDGGRGGGRILATRLDVTDPADHLAAAALAHDRFGRLDAWVNNAGVFPRAGALEISPEQFATTLSVNLAGVLYGCQAAARTMTGGGAIVNMSSVAGLRARPTRASYATSKAGVDHLTRTLAVEFGELSIRVNAVAPGFVDTEMTRWLHEVPGALDRALGSIPLGRLGRPEDVCDAVMFLLSPQSSYITGHVLVVDGGSSHGVPR